MSTRTLQAKVARLTARLCPPPIIIDCDGAKAELLAMLEAQIARDEEEETDEMTPEDYEAGCSQLNAILDQSICEIEEKYHVRLVSHEC
jgi:hypothetical protein